MSVTDEMLMAYADGELAGDELARVEAAVAADPALAEIVDSHRALRRRVSGAFAPVADEPIPENLRALLGAGAAPPTSAAPAQVVNLAQVRASVQAAKAEPATAVKKPRRWPAFAAIAATLLAVVVAGRMTVVKAPMIGVRGQTLVAQGELAKALDTQLAANPDKTAAVQVGVSFRDGDGDYCRTFQTTRGAGTAGIACKTDKAWAVAMTARSDTPEEGDYRMAASQTPAAVTAAVEGMIRGEPLDAAGEAKAKAARWK